MVRYAFPVLLATFIVVISGCTITHEFGPYSGKVVDADTSEPIEGAVVLIGFHTKSISVGGWVYSFADAVEALTNDKGEFRLAPKRINLFKVNALWDKDNSISIFKPGYGAYPNHPDTFTTPKLSQIRSIPEEKYITFHVPKLLTIEERDNNLFNIESPAGITNDKMPNLRRLESEERVIVGLEPYPDKIWRKTE